MNNKNGAWGGWVFTLAITAVVGTLLIHVFGWLTFGLLVFVHMWGFRKGKQFRASSETLMFSTMTYVAETARNYHHSWMKYGNTGADTQVDQLRMFDAVSLYATVLDYDPNHKRAVRRDDIIEASLRYVTLCKELEAEASVSPDSPVLERHQQARATLLAVVDAYVGKEK